jgi:hypothetical protein
MAFLRSALPGGLANAAVPKNVLHIAGDARYSVAMSLSDANPNYPDLRRRDTIYQDLEGLKEQLP